MREDYYLKGARELEATLLEIGPQIATRLGDRALRAGIRPIIRQAKRLVPRRSRGPKSLYRSIVAKKPRAQGGAFAATRTILLGFKKPASRRAHLVEFGFTHVGGGHVAARPFIRPAMDSQAGAALRAMVEDMAKGILSQAWKENLVDLRDTYEDEI